MNTMNNSPTSSRKIHLTENDISTKIIVFCHSSIAKYSFGPTRAIIEKIKRMESEFHLFVWTNGEETFV